MQKLAILFITIFNANAYSMALEILPMPIQQKVITFVANDKQNLNHFLRSKQVSKPWYKFITTKEVQDFLKTINQELKKEELKQMNKIFIYSCRRLNCPCATGMDNDFHRFSRC